jgi:hypothetical protein
MQHVECATLTDNCADEDNNDKTIYSVESPPASVERSVHFVQTPLQS